MPDTTFYNMWRTKNSKDRTALLDRMQEEAPALASKAGFVSMAALECENDGRVLIEGRWRSKEAFDAAVTYDPEAQKSRACLEAFGTPDPGLFNEVFRVSPARAIRRDAPEENAPISIVGIQQSAAHVNGQTIYYLKAGAGPALMLVHGYPESSLTWRKIVPELARAFTVIVPDTRGVGQSSLANDFSLEDVADDLYQLVRSLGFRKVSLVGQDFGVQIVGAYAAKHREDVAALVAIESPLSGFGLEDLFADFWHFGFMASPFAELLISGKEKEFFNAFAFENFVLRKEAFSRADIDRYVANQTRPGRLKAGLAYYRALLAGKAFFANTVAPPWTFPVLAIDGDHGMNGLTAKSFAQIAPGLTSLTARDSGHFVQEEQPEFLAQTLHQFLSKY